MVDSYKCFGAQIPCSLSKFKTNFISYIHGLTFPCSLLMMSLCSGSTDATIFIQCVDSQELQIHELWCLGVDGISRKVHPTSQAEVTSITVS